MTIQEEVAELRRRIEKLEAVLFPQKEGEDERQLIKRVVQQLKERRSKRERNR